MANELVVIEEKKELAIFTSEEGLQPLIDEVRRQVEEEAKKLDPSTEEGRAAIGSLARKIGSQKQTFMKKGKELTEDWRTKTKAVTLETSRMEKEMDALRDKVLAPRVAYQARIDARKDKYESLIEKIAVHANFDEFSLPAADEIDIAIESLNKTFALKDEGAPENWEEFEFRAQATFDESLNRLNSLRKKRIEEDKKAAELKRLQEEEKERKAEEERNRIAKEAAEQATKEAEEKAAEEAEEAQAKLDAAEAERVALENKAKQDAIDAENARIEAKKKAEADKQAAIEAEKKRQADEKAAEDARIAQEKAANDARIADVEHRKKINGEAKAAIIKHGALLDAEERAVEIVKAIVRGDIPHVSINY